MGRVAELGSLGGMSALVSTMIQIRECGAEDFDGIIVLLRQLWPGKVIDLVSLRCVYDRALTSDQQVYLCAVRDQQAVGFGSLAIKSNLWNEAPVGYVNEMVVDGAHRGRGVWHTDSRSPNFMGTQTGMQSHRAGLRISPEGRTRLLRASRLPESCLSLFEVTVTPTPPKHALHRTRRERRGCNPCLPCAGSLSLGRWAKTQCTFVG